MIVAILFSSGVEWTETCVFRVKSQFLNASGAVWTGHKIQSLAVAIKVIIYVSYCLKVSPKSSPNVFLAFSFPEINICPILYSKKRLPILRNRSSQFTEKFRRFSNVC